MARSGQTQEANILTYAHRTVRSSSRALLSANRGWKGGTSVNIDRLNADLELDAGEIESIRARAAGEAFSSTQDEQARGRLRRRLMSQLMDDAFNGPNHLVEGDAKGAALAGDEVIASLMTLRRQVEFDVYACRWPLLRSIAMWNAGPNTHP